MADKGSADTGIWRKLLIIWGIVKYSRFSVLVLAVGGALLFHDQGQAALMTLSDSLEDVWSRLLAFYLALSVWALSCWWWTRTLLCFEMPYVHGDPASLPNLIKHFPRLLGAICFVVAITAALYAAWPGGDRDDAKFDWRLIAIGAGCLVPGGLFYLYVWCRRDIYAWLLRKLPFLGKVRPIAATLEIEPEPVFGLQSVGELSPATRGWSLALLSVSVLFFVSATIWPVETGARFHPVVIFFVGIAGWVPAGSLLALLSHWNRFPTVTLVIVAAILFSFFNDNHDLRTVAAKSGYASAKQWAAGRPTMATVIQSWRLAQNVPPGGRRPLVIVATAGGGLRAAYWTVEVLGRIRALDPGNESRFDRQLFAISGVSGGSLGAAVYRALLSAKPIKCGKARTAGQPNLGRYASATLRDCGLAVLRADFLASLTASLLYPETLQHFLPVALIRPDRAGVLELSWEQAWRNALRALGPNSAANLFGGPFHALWPRAGQAWDGPALFLNGTSTETGKRLISSNIRVETTVFRDAFDLFAVLGTDVPLSTAANNSARFPFVEPAGTLTFDCGRLALKTDTLPSDRKQLQKRCGSDGARRGRKIDWGHVVDGGYFENFGATTALEVFNAVAAMALKGDVTAPAAGLIFPVVIQSSSDPEIRVGKNSKIETRRARRFANESLSPVLTLAATRGARGSYATAALAARVEKLGGAYLHFRMCKSTRHRDPPLGWTMARHSFEEIATDDIDKGMINRCGNRKKLDLLRKCLSHDPKVQQECRKETARAYRVSSN